MEQFLVELYLPRAQAPRLREVADRAHAAAEEMTREGTTIHYLRAIFLGGDEICFHLYEAESRELVVEATRRAAIPVERVVTAISVEIR